MQSFPNHPFSFSETEIDQGQADLDQVQAQESHLLIFRAIGKQFASTSGENEAIHTVPLLNDVQGFLDVLSESHIAEILAKEDGLDHTAQLVKSLIGGVLKVAPCKAPQQRISLRRSCRESRSVF